MDDEKLVLDISAKMLKSLGFEVVCAKNGEEAIKMEYKLNAKL